jgi:predicted nucleic acid-binding protein
VGRLVPQIARRGSQAWTLVDQRSRLCRVRDRIRTQSACDLELAQFDLTYSDLTKPAAFRAVQAFRLYRGTGGVRTNVLADFLIGGHASVLGIALLTRDAKRYRTYFPELALLTPDAS